MSIKGSIMERKRIYGILILLLYCGIATAQVVVKGNVYGGGEIGKVTVDPNVTNTGNTSVTINGGTVRQTVYGGGMGADDDVSAGLVEGNTQVTMTGGQVRHSVYGGGELGSVGTFTSYNTVNFDAPDSNGNESVNVPSVCTAGTGLAKVRISGGQVGIDSALMPNAHIPDLDDYGYVFCGGKGLADSIGNHLANGFAVTDTTYLEISGGLITASAYGGSENGLVLGNIHVKMSGGQIGIGHDTLANGSHYWDSVYTSTQWDNALSAVQSGDEDDINDIASYFHNCDHWPYDRSNFTIYDIYAGTTGYDSDGGSLYATNGHSFFGNLFGGGSGYYPIAAGVWRRTAGQVKGNVLVEIEGGHILTCVYGGNEYTDVLGKVTVNMTGGTVGVPRTVENIQNNPVTGMLFGAGMGDPRIAFNTWTNIPEVEVNVTDDAVIYGSIYGGGEDGHVTGDVHVTVDEDAFIGIWGTSGFDGNVFGAGRGFAGKAYTAGTVKGNVTVDINGGTMLGSIYGGGRLASVGLHLVNTTDITNYGKFVEDDANGTYGYVTVNINGGTIGNTIEAPTGHTKGGNIYGGSMGRILNVDLTTENHLWPGLARAKHTKVNLNSGTNGSAVIKGNVYGGAELGIVRDSSIVVVNGGIVDRSVYGGGYGSSDTTFKTNDSLVHPAKLAGMVQGHTLVEMKSGQVKGNIYGGGELASVGMVNNGNLRNGHSNVVISGGSVGVDNVYTTDNYFHVNNNTIPRTDIGHVYGGSQGYQNDTLHKAYGNVNYTKVTLSGTARVYGSVFGGGSDSHVLGNDSVFISAGALLGTSGVTSWDGNVFGGGQGSGYYVVDGSDTTFQVRKTCGRVEGNTYVKMDGGTLMGSIFGGGRLALTGVDVNGDYNNDNAKGLATVFVDGGILGRVNNEDNETNYRYLLQSDESVGDIFGSGKGDTENYDDVLAGRVTNANVTVTGTAVVRGGVFGGGEMASVGYWNESTGAFESGTGVTEVTIGTQNESYNPEIGLDYEYTVGYANNPGQWTIYDTLSYVVNNEIQRVVKIKHTATGNVYGACQGDVDPESPSWVSMAHSNTSTVNIYGGTIKSNVYGGAEQGTVQGNSTVAVYGGTIGKTTGLVADTLKPNNVVTHDGIYYFGSVYGGGYGSDNMEKHWNDLCTESGNDTTFVLAPEIAGRTFGNTSVTFSGGRVVQDVFGGGDIASVGQDNLAEGKCTVVVNGGNVGLSTFYDNSTQSNGGHVFGGGRGISEDALQQFNAYCNVNNTKVTISGNGKVWGSVFGGGAYGHVIGNDSVYIASDTIIGTQGTSSYDGNVYGGGRGNNYNLAAGRVGGNTFVEMTKGKVLGCIYGGGRFGITGVDATGILMQDGDGHGNTKVLVKGGIVGNNAKTNTNSQDPDEIVIETFADFSMGSVYGGGKGDANGVFNHPVESALLRGSVKNTEVHISEQSSTVPTHVYGIVFGGGEVANVGTYTWDTVDANLFANINILANTGIAKVTIDGGIIGGDRSQMRDSLVSYANDDNYWTLYNDDLGYVYGGGEGIVDNPNQPQYPIVNTAFGDTRLIDLMATVNHTEVTITTNTTNNTKPWVKGSVFGGGEAGHVRGNTLVKIQGGQIGAGAGNSGDLLYADNQFINPLTTPITEANALSGTIHWIFGDTIITNPNTPQADTTVYYRPFDLVDLKAKKVPSDGKSWFGNVFGGGSGWFPYVVNPGETNAACAWNPNSGKVWGNTHVIVEGGHILNNVYGANESTDVGGNSLVEIKGGTVGVPRTTQQIKDQPCSGFVFGGGSGDPRPEFDTITLVDSTNVIITGGIVYSSVFGGAEDGHVLGSTKVTVNGNNNTVIGSSGLSTADGNVFGGGRNFLGENDKAGRVEGNIEINMINGTLMGSIYGGGRMALAGINVDGEFPTSDWDPTEHGNVTINVSGGEIGNSRDQGIHLLCENDESVGDIFGSGKGDTKNYANNKSGRVTNATISITGNPIINGAVFGGGEMASLGWWDETDGTYYENTGKATITIGTEGQNDNPVIGTLLELNSDYLNNNFTTVGGIHYNRSKWTMVDSVLVDNVKRVRLVHTCTGNVFGGCQGDVDFEGWVNSNPNTWNDWPHMGRSRASEVIVYGGTIMSSVFGGSEQGTVAGDTKVTIKGGTIGNEVTDSQNDKYNFGDVYGAGYGSDDPEEDEHPITFFGVETRTDSVAGRVFGNAQADIFGGTLRNNVFGGSAFAYVGTDGNANLGTTVNIGSSTQANYTLAGNVYGGNNRKGSVIGSINVNVNAGNLGDASGNRTDVFGGGYGEHTATAGDVTVTVNKLGSTAPNVFGDIYGGSAFGSVNDNQGNDTTRVNIINGFIKKSTTRDITYGGDVYGGGLGETGNATKGQVNGVIQVNVGQFAHQTTSTNPDTVVYFGYATIENNVYGGNNSGGSPQENVVVNLYGTAHTDGVNTVDDEGYAIDQVFGGGNFADHAAVGDTAFVNIFGCDNTVRRVFGGGDAAASQNVSTDIQGGRFDNVFGGGNGERPGYPANINGNVILGIHGGEVNMFFAGSNQNGAISGTTTVNVDDNGPCGDHMNIDEFFCGGNYQDVNHDINATITCANGMTVRNLYGGCNQANVTGNIHLTVQGGTYENVYGGSKGRLADPNANPPITEKSANITGNVILDIQGGTIDTVFGGCNVLGNIDGYIQINVLDTVRNCPTVIHNVYGGGRNASYTPTVATGNYPEINILKGTISQKEINTAQGIVYTGGNVFGGGFGNTAVVTSNPKVTIGDGNAAHSSYESVVEGSVYGGGHKANVIGNPYIIFDGTSKVEIKGDVFGGGSEAVVNGDTKVEIKEPTQPAQP